MKFYLTCTMNRVTPERAAEFADKYPIGVLRGDSYHVLSRKPTHTNQKAFALTVNEFHSLRAKIASGPFSR
jgi:hypothetical protein